MPEREGSTTVAGASGRRRAGSGPGRILVAVYGVLALAATGRSVLQIALYFERSPLAYVLSAVAAVVYVIATVALSRGDRTSTRVATVAITVELVGVLTVGLASYLVPSAFPDKTVWSHFGQGYGYVPLVLPVLGLWWLRTVRLRDEAAAGVTPDDTADETPDGTPGGTADGAAAQA